MNKRDVNDVVGQILIFSDEYKKAAKEAKRLEFGYLQVNSNGTISFISKQDITKRIRDEAIDLFNMAELDHILETTQTPDDLKIQIRNALNVMWAKKDIEKHS